MSPTWGKSKGATRCDTEKPSLGIEVVEQRVKVVLVGSTPVEQHQAPDSLVLGRTRLVNEQVYIAH